jgi:hypothetical protein
MLALIRAFFYRALVVEIEAHWPWPPPREKQQA